MTTARGGVRRNAGNNLVNRVTLDPDVAHMIRVVTKDRNDGRATRVEVSKVVNDLLRSLLEDDERTQPNALP